MDVQIEQSWKEALQHEFNKPYFEELAAFLKKEIAAGKTIYPPGKFIFNAFNITSFDEVKVVILGQDPYHNPGQAHGLCFSVQEGITPPPSLVNIYKEIQSDLNIPPPNHGYLMKWAEQGVLLLNASLTVEKNKPMSHSKAGWHQFTNEIIKTLSDKRDKLVFLLWGGFAKSKINLIDTNKHLVLTAAHPSPLSAHNGFFSCRHFSKANEWLEQNGKTPVNWDLN